MNFLKINKSNITLVNDCINLAKHINKFDNMNNPIFDMNDFRSTGKLPILYYATENNELVGFIGISLVDGSEIEICGFVLPQYRNLKIASHLLEMVFDDYEDFKITIPITSNNSLGKHFLKSYSAKYESTECVMELKKDNYHFQCDEIMLSTSFNQQTIIFTAYVDNNEVGVACVYNDNTFIIHNVEIYEKYRGMKYGQKLLHTLLVEQFKHSNKATLHVTKENIPASNLYTKLGFTISRQLEYYSL